LSKNDLSKIDARAISDMKTGSGIGAFLWSLLVRLFVWLATLAYRFSGDCRAWLPDAVRTSAHLAILFVAVVGIAVSALDWPAQAAKTSSEPVFSAALNTNAEPFSAPRDEIRPLDVELQTEDASEQETDAAVARLPQPHTEIPDRPRIDVVTYTVQVGDTVQSIADRFDLAPETIMWANPAIEDAPDLLRIGQEVAVLPVDGVYHEVETDDTLASIAEEYDASVQAIVDCPYNELESADDTLAEGRMLIVPGGEKPYVPKLVTPYEGTAPEGARGTGRFQWPVRGRITQGFWYGHRAVDVGIRTGSALVASDEGFVSFAGWTDVGYGNLVVIDHANGYSTYYAHMSQIYVYEGQAVERGQVIGASGNTGWSTGPHLHFEIRYNGVQQNPFAYLP